MRRISYTATNYLKVRSLSASGGAKAAAELGLSGTVDKELFDRLCDNLHPQTGDQLTNVTRDGRRVGDDMTWRAPKSISVVHALTRDESILDAFRESIREMMTDTAQPRSPPDAGD